MRTRVEPVIPTHHYESEVYQSVEIYQTTSRLLSWYYWGRVTKAIQLLLDQLGRTQAGHVLDLGCGSGMILPTLEKYFERVTAADIYTEHAAKVINHEGLSRVDLVASDGRELPFTDETFDAVLLMDILEHVEGEKNQILTECERVLRSDGYVIASFPVEVGPALIIRQIGRRFFGLEGNQQGLLEILTHSLGHKGRSNTHPETRGKSFHDEAHRGYDYKHDLSNMRKHFEDVTSIPVPFEHIQSFSPDWLKYSDLKRTDYEK